MSKSSFSCIGRISKAHGIKGELSLLLQADYLPESGLPNCFFVLKDGSYLPYFAEKLQITFGRNAILKLEELHNRTMAEPLAGHQLFLYEETAEKHFEFDEEDEIQQLLGYKVFHNDQELGRVEKVLESAAHHLLQISLNGNEVLIPLVDDFIVKRDKRRKSLYLQLPDGLLDLYLTNPDSEDSDQDDEDIESDDQRDSNLH